MPKVCKVFKATEPRVELESNPPQSPAFQHLPKPLPGRCYLELHSSLGRQDSGRDPQSGWDSTPGTEKEGKRKHTAFSSGALKRRNGSSYSFLFEHPSQDPKHFKLAGGLTVLQPNKDSYFPRFHVLQLVNKKQTLRTSLAGSL